MLIKRFILLILLTPACQIQAATNDTHWSFAPTTNADVVVVAIVNGSENSGVVDNFKYDVFCDIRISATLCGQAPERELLPVLARVPFEEWELFSARVRKGDKLILYLSGGLDCKRYPKGLSEA